MRGDDKKVRILKLEKSKKFTEKLVLQKFTVTYQRTDCSEVKCIEEESMPIQQFKTIDIANQKCCIILDKSDTAIRIFAKVSRQEAMRSLAA